jgi:hypothetical protein
LADILSGNNEFVNIEKQIARHSHTDGESKCHRLVLDAGDQLLQNKNRNFDDIIEKQVNTLTDIHPLPPAIF